MKRLVCATLITLMIGTSSLGAADAPPAPVLVVTAQEPEFSDPHSDGNLLVRELARQALLIAARDGLGMATRDQTLREPLPADAALTLAVKTELIEGVSWEITVSKAGEKPEQLWTRKIPITAGDNPDILQLATVAEELSRNEFVMMLKAAGIAGKVPAANTAAVPVEIEKHLQHLTCLAQYAGVRGLHSEIQKNGESPNTVAALVRGYANLSQLTRNHWNASFRAYEARSLLYAQRLMAKKDGSPVALWAHAYALAFAGRHAAALADIAAARKLEPPAPRKGFGWYDAIELYCHFDTDKLDAYADFDYSELALFLRYLTVEKSGGHGDIQNAVYAMLQANPGCYRVYDGLWQMRGVSALHRATVEAPTMLARTLYKHLKAMPELPPALTQAIDDTAALDDGERREKVLNAFASEAARDRGEPSWAVLGRMMQDATFLQVYMRAEFMKNIWGVDVSDYLTQALPLIDTHPYRKIVEVFGLDYQREWDKAIARFKEIDLLDITFAERPYVDLTWRVNVPGKKLGPAAWRMAFLHNDDIEDQVVFADNGRKPQVARDLLALSPFHPLACATLISFDWEFAKDHADEWEREFGRHASVLRALGSRYLQLGKLTEAERCLLPCIKQSPDRWTYDMLADVYLKQGNAGKWQATLDEYLQNVADPGLEHANVRVKIAKHFMEQRQWDKAQPYADAAADTWAAWGMSCARDCHEGMGDFETAEMWQCRISERYEGSELEWFLWCKRTGHGNVKKSAELASQHFTSIAGRATPDDYINMGVYHLLLAEQEEALAPFQQSFEKTHNPYAGLQAALGADVLKRNDLRDKLLKDVVEQGAAFLDNNRPRTEMIDAAKWMAETLAKGADAKPDVDAVDRIIGKASSGEQLNIQFLVARFLDQHGTKEQAKDYYDRVATSGNKQKFVVTLALDALRVRGEKPGDVKRDPAAGKNDF
jgi:hypothetical protein